jgi:peptidoglycan/LPS O-acetylase OafA/YrhL
MQRLTRMDGLRGVLAVYVMLGHALALTNLPGWVLALFAHGEAGVDLFFALSGLVIVNALERFDGAFAPFMRARGRRLLPVYFIVLAVSILLVGLGDPLRTMPWVGVAGREVMETGLPGGLGWHVAAHVALVQGMIPQGALPYAYVTLLGPAWSLSTEWQFYALIGLAAPKRLGWFALGLLGLGIAYRGLALPPWWQFSRAFLPDAAPYFALGIATAIALRGGGWRVFGLCMALVCGLEFLTGGVGKALVPLAWAGVVLAQGHQFGVVLEARAVRYLGLISYPLYLVNEPVQRGLAMIFAPLARGDATLFTILFLPLAVAAAVAAAAVLHHGVEKPFMRSVGNKQREQPVCV